MCDFWQKKDIDNQKVQVADEFKREIRKYLVKTDLADDAWYINVSNISSCAK